MGLSKADQECAADGQYGGQDAQWAQGLAEKDDAHQGRNQNAGLAQRSHQGDRPTVMAQMAKP
jgi:hypothetical protein